MNQAGKLGREAVVVGSGIGGLAAARVLSDHFDRVTIFERDPLSDDGAARGGVPQGKHLHALLAGGQRVLDDLFPGFSDDVDRLGAVQLTVGLDLRVEQPGFDPFPQRDLGFYASALTRPQLELCVRRRVEALKNVRCEAGCRVLAVLTRENGRSVQGVTYRREGRSHSHAADMVVDASGTGDLTLAALVATGHPSPPETTIGVDIAYSSAVFEIPPDASREWKGVMHVPDAPTTSRAGLMLPVEGGLWMLVLIGRHDEHPPGDQAGVRHYATTLRTTTIADAIRSARWVSGVDRYRFSESRFRHYDRVETFPSGLLPIGDAICRFNPIFAQGMSVALLEAQALGRLFGAIAASSSKDAEEGLGRAWRPFFQRVAEIVQAPWAFAVVPDFVFPRTSGQRPPGFEASLLFSAALSRASAQHADIHKLVAEVQHLVRPRSDLMDPQLIERVMREMAEAGSS